MTTINMTQDDPMADNFSKEMRLHIAKLFDGWTCEGAMVFADEAAADRWLARAPSGFAKWECNLDCGAAQFPVWVVAARLHRQMVAP